jgi:hypothetical protein
MATQNSQIKEKKEQENLIMDGILNEGMQLILSTGIFYNEFIRSLKFFQNKVNSCFP